MRTASALFTVTILFASLAGRASAQIVRGVIVDQQTAAPIQGTFVQLLDSTGTVRAGVLSNDAGQYILTAPGAGHFILRAERIGYASAFSDTLEVAAGKTLVYRFTVPVQAISLEGIRVTGSRRCNTPTEGGAATSVLWDEARKALDVVAWMEAERGVPYQTAIWERTRDIVSLEIEDGERRISSGFGKSAFWSHSAENLQRYGFVRNTGYGDIAYYGLDAQTLLSDAFLAAHCFRVAEPHKGEGGLIGLSFEPLRKNGPPDIEGTLWLDRKTSELRYLEFQYTRHLVATMVANDHFGGRIEFRRMPNGAWVVGRWWLRMPLWTESPPAPGHRRASGMGVGAHNRLWAARADGLKVREKGGEIVFMARPRSSAEEGSAALEGTVYDSVRGRPLAGATVFLVDAGQAVVTDMLGRYRMSDLPAGRHVIGFFHRFTDSLQLTAITRPVDLLAAKHNSIDLAVPRNAGCGFSPSSSTVVGFVEDVETGDPLPGVEVTGTWRERRDTVETDPVEHVDSTDARGRYLFCGVPVDEPVSLEPDEGRPVKLLLQSPGIVSQDLVAKASGS